jgi:hypothetical protein
MITGIKTATEAKADALVWQQLLAAPDGIGQKIHGQLLKLMEWQKHHPDALLVNIPNSEPFIIPTAALPSITTTYGYILTSQSTPKPSDYKGPIVNWSKVTRVSWNI